MEAELEPGLKYLPFKVKAMSRESPSQKASHVADPDLRSHWSTATNSKEWILLELLEPCLLSHIRIHNKSVLEWEISAGLRYKPEAFVKVRTRCDAPKRDILYPANYTPCRYVRLSCLRGNPIAIFFIQLIGVVVPGLETELLPVVNHLLPHIMSHKQDTEDLHLQLLQDIAAKLVPFLPQLEPDLTRSADDMESVVRFFAMLAGPFYPILSIVNERDGGRTLSSQIDSDTSKNQTLPPTLLVSSNFELLQPRRGKSPVSGHPSLSSVAYRSDAVILLLRKAFKEKHLGIVCRKVAIVLHSLSGPMQFVPRLSSDETARNEVAGCTHISDYSRLFGEEYRILEVISDATCFNLLDLSSIEEGLLHVLYSSASQPILCSKLAESNADILPILPLVQALLPALRPPLNGISADQIDDSFRQWSQPSIQHALSQVVMMSSSMAYRPLLEACAGYLSSYSLSHAKAACVLIDLCSGPLSPWIPIVMAKVDLAVEVLTEVLSLIQDAKHSPCQSRAALKYVILAISGHLDDVLPAYKETKNKLLFLLEMLEPFLDPAMTPMKNTIAFGGVSAIFSEKQEKNCEIALNVIRAAVKKPAVLPSLELEWRTKAVAPSALLAILDPHISLPPEVDLRKNPENHSLYQSAPSVSSDGGLKIDEITDRSFFAPAELKQSSLASFSFPSIESHPRETIRDTISPKSLEEKNSMFINFKLENSPLTDYYNTQADYLQLVNYQECEARAMEFQHLALDLCSRADITPENHKAGIEALLLAAECYMNPFFLVTFRPNSEVANQINKIRSKITQQSGSDLPEINNSFTDVKPKLAELTDIEKKRDRAVIDILLRAAKLESEYMSRTSSGELLVNEGEQADKKHGSLIDISEPDMQSADAVTLVRNNQSLLCHFIVRQFEAGDHSSHEILLQSLLFLLYSATKLCCSPKDVINIILRSAENLSTQLVLFYQQVKARNAQNLVAEKLHGFRRRWILLQKLVMASSGDHNGKEGLQLRSLISPSSWIEKILELTQYKQPLPRFLNWMAVSRYAKEYLNERLFLTSDFSQLTILLSVFADELALMKGAPNKKTDTDFFETIYPGLHLFFPSMSDDFHSFGERILEAIGLQLKCLSHSAVPDILSWFSDMCLWPFFDGCIKGRVAINAKASVLYILESIVSEHMEAMVPEMPRVAHALVALCKASYADVAFLESVLCILKPLVSYFLKKATNEEELSADPSICQDFEFTGFEELFNIICHKTEAADDFQMPLLIFILGTLFPDLSFKRQTEILESLVLLTDFVSSGEPHLFNSNLHAFQRVTDGCEIVLVESLKSFNVHVPFEKKPDNDSSALLKEGELDSNLLLMLSKSSSDNKPKIEKLTNALEKLISQLISSIEASWKLHHQLSMKLSQSIAQCMLYSVSLKFVITTTSDVTTEHKNWFTALEQLVGLIITSQKKQCWHVASAMIDYILLLSKELSLNPVISALCSAIKYICLHAPTISLRLQTDKWVPILSGSKKTFNFHENNALSSSLADLFNTMLSHPEPEQRSIALHQLRKIVNNTSNPETESVVPVLASKNWESVVKTGLTDPSMQLRKQAMVLLSEWVPYLERIKLQSFLQSSDAFLQRMGNLSQTTERGHITRLSLLLLGNACLYSPDDDIGLIPQAVWIALENMLASITGGISDLEKDLCEALCQLKTESSAKGALKEVLSTSAIVKPSDPGFTRVRETVLQALSSLASVESYFEFFSRSADQESQELEEAEIEIELIQKERALTDISKQTPEGDFFQSSLSNYKDDKKPNERLQQIKDGIRDLEKSKLKEEIMVRRQKKLLFRQARQKYLEELNSREMELLQELDREKAAESEREIERQRQLDTERAKTRELQFNLEMEREKMAQKELQRELEQVESGARPSRRDYTSGSTSRPRRERDDRYRERERENGRPGQLEGNTRSTSRGHDSNQMGTTASSMPTVMLSGSNRPYINQQPTMILQSRDRSDDRGGMAYEDSVEIGSRDSGDANSVGESELGFDGYGSGVRRGGGRTRHGGERRERESVRREGKWERKQ